MEHLTRDQREALFKSRFILLPTKLAFTTQKWDIDTEDICIEAVQHEIRERKHAYLYTENQSSTDPS
jgi:hypothetical protein